MKWELPKIRFAIGKTSTTITATNREMLILLCMLCLLGLLGIVIYLMV